MALLHALAAAGCTLPYGEVLRPEFWEKPAETGTRGEPPAPVPVPKSAAAAPAMARPAAPRESSVALRLAILDQLLERRLITGEEHRQRRTAHLAALPAEGPGPADRRLMEPPPPMPTIAHRLDAIGRALRAGAIGTEEHAAERTAILDALLPASTPAAAPMPSLAATGDG
jgi:hypothetical protein